MKLATRFILVFIMAVIPVIVASSHFTSQQFKTSIENEHREIAALLTKLEAKREFHQAMTTENMMYFHEQAKTVSDYSTTFRLVFFEKTVARKNQPVHPRAKSFMQALKVKSLTKLSDGHRFLHTYYPIKSTERSDAFEIVSPLDKADELYWKTWLNSLLAIVAIGLVGLGVVILAGIRWIGRPLREIIKKMQRVGQRDFESDLKIHSNDEFGKLANEINGMCQKLRQQSEEIEHETKQRIQALEQLRHADRLITVGQLAAGFAHEVGTPLNVVAGRASMILNEPDMDSNKIKENALAIKNEAMRISSIVEKGLGYARPSVSNKSAGDLREVVYHAVELFRPAATRRHIEIEVAVSDEVANAVFDFNELQQVLMNLIDNAIDASSDGDPIDVKLQHDEAGKKWILEVADRGHGIDPADHEKVFEPFFTTRGEGYGTGLGLSIVRDIVEEHDGTIRFSSGRGSGTSFFIELPAI